MSDRFLLVGVLALTLLCYFAHEWFNRLPPVIPASFQNQFSGERAIDLTRRLLGDESPHPVGSPENREVRKRIQTWLDEQGIAHEVQRTWGCSQAWGRCAIAENVIATIPGQRDGPHVALMAHYDSVPPAPGAGDNAIAVATMMEVGRLIKSAGELVNPLTLLLVDAEEQGLIGAEAFFARHRLRDQIGVLVNLEGSVNPGRTILFRTSGPNRGTLRLFGGAPHVAGSSHQNEIFNHMAVDTDFAVPKRHGVTGIDFGKVGNRSLSHTRLDTTARLHGPSIQFMGDNIYHVARELVHADLENLPEGRDAYGNLYGLWLQWPVGFNLVLVAIAFIALAITSGRRCEACLTHPSCRWACSS
ncbi:MAG: M28 family peptidase [Gammaproteobacteria bacterium]|nr:M28 family peptidase [Gammaproteobacteria bacterium]